MRVASDQSIMFFVGRRLWLRLAPVGLAPSLHGRAELPQGQFIDLARGEPYDGSASVEGGEAEFAAGERLDASASSPAADSPRRSSGAPTTAAPTIA